MPSLDLHGTKLILEAWPQPAHANDNAGVKPDWMTPAELMQWVQRTRDEMRRELAADFTLRTCPTHRRHWQALEEIEQYARWHYLGER